MEYNEKNNLSKILVQKEVTYWIKRVYNLYTVIQEWLIDKPEYKLVVGRPIMMFEELMQLYGIKPQEVNTADLFKDNYLLLTFKPKGLWIIGANGRIDIISRKGNYILVDYSNKFQNSRWHIHTAQDKNNGKLFNRDDLLDIL
ncbi:MAG: hypothetical protein HQ534_05605 [Armatimonadetes bacterium]|nr:hypothetical protein [Armatimonadota bacterium]